MENRIQKLDGKLDPGKHLYVAYGSNLNLEQMAGPAICSRFRLEP